MAWADRKPNFLGRQLAVRIMYLFLLQSVPIIVLRVGNERGEAEALRDTLRVFRFLVQLQERDKPRRALPADHRNAEIVKGEGTRDASRSESGALSGGIASGSLDRHSTSGDTVAAGSAKPGSWVAGTAFANT